MPKVRGFAHNFVSQEYRKGSPEQSASDAGQVGCLEVEDSLPREPCPLAGWCWGWKGPELILPLLDCNWSWRLEHVPGGSPFGLGISHRGGWICKGNIPRSSIPKAEAEAAGLLST